MIENSGATVTTHKPYSGLMFFYFFHLFVKIGMDEKKFRKTLVERYIRDSWIRNRIPGRCTSSLCLIYRTFANDA